MPNFLQDIQAVLAGEEPEAWVCGGRGYRRGADDTRLERCSHGVVLSWNEALTALDYDYDAGFGGVDCNSVYIWTATRILFVDEYDGSTSVCSIPRNPQAGMPGLPGGG